VKEEVNEGRKIAREEMKRMKERGKYSE